MVTCHSSFWNELQERNTTGTDLMFPNLRPGTRYDFNVRVVVGNLISEPETDHAITGKDTTFCFFMKQIFGFICIGCIS